MMQSVKSLPLQRVAAEGIVEPIVVRADCRARSAKCARRRRDAISKVYVRQVTTITDDDDDDDDDADDLDDDDDDGDDDDDDDSTPPRKGVWPTPQSTTMVETLTIPTSSRLFGSLPAPTPTSNPSFRPPPSTNPAAQMMTVTTTVVSAISSMTMAQLRPSALAESQTSDQTVFVTLQPTPPPRPPPFKPHHTGISETTQHALIAVGSILATILVMIFIWIFVRKQQGMRLSEAAGLRRRDRYKSIEEVTPPLGRWSAAGTAWDKKLAQESEGMHERALNGISGLPSRPSATVTRNNSAASKLRKQDGRRPSDANSENWPMQQPKALSAVASSVTMPANAHVDEGSSTYDQEETNSSVSSLPTYLKGARNIPPRRIEASRFSWTNSQAPRTPATIAPNVNGDAIGYTRYSVATTRSSVARFRTVDSWVGNQAGRIDEESIQEYIQRYGPQMPTEPVPDMPKQFQTGNNNNNTANNANTKQAYQVKHHTNLSDATIFNQHPGTKLVIPRTSTVPSDILDGQVMVRKGRDDQSI